MKKLVSVLASAALCLTLSAVAFADSAFVTNQSLTQKQIEAKFLELSCKYKINEAFSPEDAAFVKKYAIVIDPSNCRKTRALSWGTGKHFIGYGKGNYSDVKTEGYMVVDLGFLSNTVQVNMNTSDTSEKYHSKIGNSLKFQGFGVIGSDGIGIVADFTLSDENKNSTYHKFLSEKSFMASVAYFEVVPLGYVKDEGHSSQSITVTFD